MPGCSRSVTDTVCKAVFSATGKRHRFLSLPPFVVFPFLNAIITRGSLAKQAPSSLCVWASAWQDKAGSTSTRAVLALRVLDLGRLAGALSWRGGGAYLAKVVGFLSHNHPWAGRICGVMLVGGHDTPVMQRILTKMKMAMRSLEGVDCEARRGGTEVVRLRGLALQHEGIERRPWLKF